MHEEFESFTRNEDHQMIKKIVEQQFDTVCNGELPEKYVRRLLQKKTYDFGFISKTPRAHTRYGNKDFTVHSFILCEIKNQIEIEIKIICSNKKRDGKKLLQYLETYVMTTMKDIKYISLQALNKKKLLRWYNDNGYKRKYDPFYPEEDKSIILYKELNI